MHLNIRSIPANLHRFCVTWITSTTDFLSLAWQKHGWSSQISLCMVSLDTVTLVSPDHMEWRGCFCINIRCIYVFRTHWIVYGLRLYWMYIYKDHAQWLVLCIYTGNTRVTVSNIKDKLDQFEKAVKDKKAIPVFCTITNMNIQLYNEHLLKTHKTHTLHHTANYHKMQPLIDTIIYQVNYYIIGKNIANKVSTPYFHSVIRTKKGNKRKHSKFFYTDNWGGLSDGVHGTYDTRLKWAKCLSNSIDLNRGTKSKLKHSIDNMETNNKRKHSTDNISSDDEPHSPKRSWRRDRTN